MNEKLDEIESGKARAEQQLGFDRAPLESTLPTSMTHQQMLARNAKFWRNEAEPVAHE